MRRRRVDRCRHGGDARERGFSLLEILVAFVILALVLGGVLRVFAGGLNSLDLQAGYARAAKLAEARLVEAGRSEPLAAGVTAGEWGDYRWQRRATPTTLGREELPLPGELFEVQVTVAWAQGRRERTFTLTSLRFQPEAEAEQRRRGREQE